MSPATTRRPIRAAAPQQNESNVPVFDVRLFLESPGLRRKVNTFQKKRTRLLAGRSWKDGYEHSDGAVKLTVVNETGREAVVAILGTGAFFGGRLPLGPVHLHGDLLIKRRSHSEKQKI